MRRPGLLSRLVAYVLLVLCLYALTVARATRLVARDKITEPFRAWIVRRFGEQSQITFLFFCQACLSVWVAAALAPIVFAMTGLPWWLCPFVAAAGTEVTILLTRIDT